VASAFDFAGGDIDLTFGQAEVFVAASVIEHVHVAFNAHYDEHEPVEAHLAGLTVDEVVQDPDVQRLHGATTFRLANADVTSRSTSSASSIGSVVNISLKNP